MFVCGCYKLWVIIIWQFFMAYCHILNALYHYHLINNRVSQSHCHTLQRPTTGNCNQNISRYYRPLTPHHPWTLYYRRFLVFRKNESWTGAETVKNNQPIISVNKKDSTRHIACSSSICNCSQKLRLGVG